jgi:ATP/maltotriose-dependent transcriptional regulator MalT
LCDLVPGNENSEAVISRLVREFPIVTAIEGPGRRYEYAPPLAASLRRLAGSAGFGETPPAWQWRAAEWLVAEGELAAAAELALRAGDDDLIVHTFEALCRHLADRSDLDTMGGWLDRVAGATLGSSPSLSYWKIVSRLGLGQTVGMKDLVDEVEPYWLASGDSLQAGRAFLCRGMLAFFDGDLDEADRRLAEAWARLPEDALVERLYAATFRGKLAFRRGKDEPAAILLGEAVSCAMQLPVEEQWSWRVIAPDRGNAYALRGDLFSAITKYRLMLAELPATHRGLEGFLRCRLVTLAIERDDMDTANHEYEILERIGDGDRQAWHRQAVFARMRLLLAAGQRDEADAWGAAHLKDFRRLPEKNQLVLLLATIWLDRGELPMVRSWLRDIGTPAYPWVQEFGDISPHTLAIDLDLVEGNHGHAAVVAQELANEAAATKRWTEFIGLSVRSAIAHHELGELERDIEILRPAIRVGAKGGFVRTFDVRGYNILSMFSDLWSENREVLEVKGNLQRLQPSPPNDPSALITRREREVIQLVAQGLSNQQIADSMFISVNTVRNHLVRISRRLNARSRTEVVAKARRSGILV